MRTSEISTCFLAFEASDWICWTCWRKFFSSWGDWAFKMVRASGRSQHLEGTVGIASQWTCAHGFIGPSICRRNPQTTLSNPTVCFRHASEVACIFNFLLPSHHSGSRHAAWPNRVAMLWFAVRLKNQLRSGYITPSKVLKATVHKRQNTNWTHGLCDILESLVGWIVVCSALPQPSLFACCASGAVALMVGALLNFELVSEQWQAERTGPRHGQTNQTQYTTASGIDEFVCKRAAEHMQGAMIGSSFLMINIQWCPLKLKLKLRTSVNGRNCSLVCLHNSV